MGEAEPVAVACTGVALGAAVREAGPKDPVAARSGEAVPGSGVSVPACSDAEGNGVAEAAPDSEGRATVAVGWLGVSEACPLTEAEGEASTERDAGSDAVAHSDAAPLALPLCDTVSPEVAVLVPRAERVAEACGEGDCVEEGEFVGWVDGEGLADARDEGVAGDEAEGEALPRGESVGSSGVEVATGADGVAGGVMLPGNGVPLGGALGEGGALRLDEAQEDALGDGIGEADAVANALVEGKVDSEGGAVELPPPRASSCEGDVEALVVARSGVPLPAAVEVATSELGEAETLVLPTSEGDALPLWLGSGDAVGSGDLEAEGVGRGEPDAEGERRGVGEGGGVRLRRGDAEAEERGEAVLVAGGVLEAGEEEAVESGGLAEAPLVCEATRGVGVARDVAENSSEAVAARGEGVGTDEVVVLLSADALAVGAPSVALAVALPSTPLGEGSEVPQALGEGVIRPLLEGGGEDDAQPVGRALAEGVAAAPVELPKGVAVVLWDGEALGLAGVGVGGAEGEAISGVDDAVAQSLPLPRCAAVGEPDAEGGALGDGTPLPVPGAL